MNNIDIAIIVVMLASGALGIYWGLIRQVLSVVGMIAGVVLAAHYGADVADWLSSFVSVGALAQALGFLIVLFGVSGLASLLATLLRRFVGLLFLGWLDHLIGGVLGLLQAAIFCTVVVVVLAAFPTTLWAPLITESQLAPVLVRLFSVVLLLLPESFRFAATITLNAP